MKLQTMSNYAVFFTLIFIVDSSVAFNCDTTLIANDPSQEYNDQIYLADCRIEMQDSSPFIISSGHTAKLTAEQIRLDPGFHAQRGSHFHAKYRECIRNPDKNTGYASWGNYDISESGEMWMKTTAEEFVRNINNREGLTVELINEEELAQYEISIPDLYRDGTLISTGRDDDDFLRIVGEDPLERKVHVQGIDKGVFHFHVGHGGGAGRGFQVRNGNQTASSDGTSTQIEWDEIVLGNCRSDGSETGELRYLLLCSCRTMAHGPGYTDNDGDVEYDRPSKFDLSIANHMNVFDRLRDWLSPNMRMVCGISTTAGCSRPDVRMTALKDYYFNEGRTVADSWGLAFTLDSPTRGTFTDAKGADRSVYQTPICIARGNLNAHDLRSPITDDQFFTEKANPYDEALHIKSWEGVLTAGNWNLTEHEDVEGLEEHLRTLPIFLTSSSSPSTWFVEESNTLTNIDQINTQNFQNQFSIHNNRLISKNMTNEGVPMVIVDTKSGAISLSRDRKPVSINDNKSKLSVEKYAEIAQNFIYKQGWNESDIGNISAVSGMLQVKPLDTQVNAATTLLKLQHDITFFVGRRIPLGKISPKVFGSDNQIVVQMNNDGTVKSASKKWKKITKKIEGIPVKSYEEAYAEAVKEFKYPGLYKLSTWDWGYKSITDDSGQDMMVIYYVFTFDPLSIVNACIDMPRVIEIQGHILEKIKGGKYQKGQQG